MSSFPPNPNLPPKKPINMIWMVLGAVCGLGLLCVALCCGGLVWFSSFPSVAATANQLFDLPQNPNFATSSASDRKTSDGIPYQEIVFGDGSGFGEPGANMRLWVYSPAEKSADRSLPCVLICGAGSNLLQGMQLADGDIAEHTPYVQAGFKVIAYDLDGPGSNDFDVDAFTAFQASRAGLVNARIALNYALTQCSDVDPTKIFAVGHSSAATHALLFSEHEPQLVGCVAYAPASDLKARLPGFLVRTLAGSLKGAPEFIVQSSPRTHESRMQCRVMLFHAKDDDVIPFSQSKDFAERLKNAGKDVTFVEAESGGHYDSMINNGIPAGINWMKKF